MDCGGYECNFVEDPAEIFKCIVCHLALKNPVMLVECGHRVCKGCFRELIRHTEGGKVLCPLDRTQVDVDKVVEDKGIARTILDFKVKCENSSIGCSWVGELRNLEKHHDNQCQLNASKKNSKIIEELLRRVGSCESKLEKKDNEIEALNQLNQKFETRINTLERQVVNLTEKLSAQPSRPQDESQVESQGENQTGSLVVSNGRRIMSDHESEESDGDSDSEEDEEETDHEEVCHVCNTDGTLILCDTCPFSFHLECHTPPMRHAPRGQWSCCVCTNKRRTRKRHATTDTESLLVN